MHDSWCREEGSPLVLAVGRQLFFDWLMNRRGSMCREAEVVVRSSAWSVGKQWLSWSSIPIYWCDLRKVVCQLVQAGYSGAVKPWVHVITVDENGIDA